MPGSKKLYEGLQSNLSPANDKDSVVGIGKEKTFDYFFRQYYAALCFFAQSIIHNEEDAKDIVQDCFIKLWNNEFIEEKKDTVKSFLYTIVHNSCINYLKKKQVATKAVSHLQIINEDLEYFDELAFAEMMRQILGYLEELPANMTNILKQYYLQGKKHKEIAAKLSTTSNAVQLQKARAIKLLKQKLLLFINLLLIFF
jgi:RNA polymerase sigma-70 factor (ECF subfamily)